MAKRKGDKLTLEKVENMNEEKHSLRMSLSLDEESECSEYEDLSQSLATYLHRWRVQRNQAMTVLMKTMNRTQKLLIGLVEYDFTC